MGIKKLLGEKIKKLRLSKGYTQEELSEKIKISQRALSGIERGVNFLTAETLDKIVNVLNVSINDLFMLEHLKDSKDLVKELHEIITRLENNPLKLQEIYKVVKVILSE